MSRFYKNPRTLSLFWMMLIGFYFVLLMTQTQVLFAGEWQKKYDYKQLQRNFEKPPLWYAPHTFWFWDAPLNAELTAAMAKEIVKQRLNPGYAHARHSGAPAKAYPSLPVEEWLSPKWLQSFSAALKEAEKVGMTLGYCDEYWWPSGQAAGRVLEHHPELAAQSLQWTRRIFQGPGVIEIPALKFTVAGKLSGNDLLMANSLQIIGEDAAFKWNVPQGKWVIYSYSLYFHPGVDGGKVNYLNPKLMDVFMSIAHQPYEQHFGDRFGSSIPGVFVDNEGDFGWKMAWSDYLAERYLEMKKRDIRLWLPLLTEKDREGIWAKARYDCFDVVSDVYSRQFLGRLSNWLSERGMYCISNLWEEDLMLQTRAVGDFMRAQRAVSLPGNDCLQMKSQQVHDFKETQSVCEFEDRPFMSELMGVAGWEQTPVQMKQTLNAVTAWGITHTVPHGINLNRKLETIPYPADWFTENPYWRYLHLWTDFARRASFVNRQGHLVADILLFNPSVINLAGKENKIELLPAKISETLQRQVEKLSGNVPLLMSHRQIDNNDFYWLANNSGRQEKCTLSFRDGKGRAEIWNCENGKINPIACEISNKRKVVNLDFKPYQALWLVFDAGKSLSNWEKRRLQKSGKLN